MFKYGIHSLPNCQVNFEKDAIIRHRRLLGKKVCWIPGLDHAGIATQSVVEKNLCLQGNRRRVDMSREEWDSAITSWKDHSSSRIIEQIRRLGLSVDWSQNYFTLDSQRSAFVQDAFIKFFQDGFIYRESKMVFWCPFLQTTISDIEIEHKEIDGATLITLPGHQKPVEIGILHYFAVKIFSGQSKGEEILVATTRPETCLGDVAFAVHRDDTRYCHLIGQTCWHPILQREVPIISDSYLVQPGKGTGVVKVSPAHDPDDYACAKRHKISFESIMDPSGIIIYPGTLFKGLDRFTCRQRVISELQDQGLYRGADRKHKMTIPLCSRSGDLIEYRVLPQWYNLFVLKLCLLNMFGIGFYGVDL